MIGLLAAGGAGAEDRLVPIGNTCAGLRMHMLDRMDDMGDGWVRARIAELDGIGLAEIPDDARRIVWDVRCADGQLAEVGHARDRAEAETLGGTAAIGTGPWPRMRCAPDQRYPGVAEMICRHHANANRSERTK